MSNLHKNIEDMTNEEIIQNINDWQEYEMTHELICGNNSNHRPLYPIEEDGQVLLRCYDCNYIQDWIPDCVMAFSKKSADIIAKKIGASFIRPPKGKEKSFF